MSDSGPNQHATEPNPHATTTPRARFVLACTTAIGAAHAAGDRRLADVALRALGELTTDLGGEGAEVVDLGRHRRRQR